MSAASWRDRWRAWRNRLLGDPRFQDWAAAFPLTRPIAHRRTAALFDVVAGFVYSQVLSACVRMGLLETLAEGPRGLPALAGRLGVGEDAAGRLLTAACALGLVERAGSGRFALGAQGAALLGAPGLRDMILHHDLLYGDLADSVGLLKRGGGGGALARYWPYAESADARGADTGAVAAYSRLMAATQPAVAVEVLHAYDVRRHRRLLDIGGGEGAFLEAAGLFAPDLQLTLFDLPAVALRAQARFLAAGLAGRAQVLSGDFLADPIPGGADLATLVRVLHDQDEAGALTLLRAVRAALAPGGTLLIAEPMSRAPRADRVSETYFGMYFLAMGRGRARTPAEIAAFLREAGFRRIRSLRTRTPSLLGVILAEP